MQGIRSASVVAGTLLGLSLLRCGDDASGAPPDFDAFLGTWSCVSTSTVVITKPSGLPSQKSTTPVTLEVTKSGASTVTIGEVGDPTCSAKLRISGTSGRLVAPFKCDQGDQTTLDVSSAEVSVSGNKLTGTRIAAVSGTGNGGEMLSGNATTKIDCTRSNGAADAGGAGSGGQAGSGGGGNAPSDGAAGADCTASSDCPTCCDDKLPDGLSRLQELLIQCACQQCATECAASLCDASNPNQPKPGDACDSCARAVIDTGGVCLESTISTCDTDDVCSPYTNCIAACP